MANHSLPMSLSESVLLLLSHRWYVPFSFFFLLPSSPGWLMMTSWGFQGIRYSEVFTAGDIQRWFHIVHLCVATLDFLGAPHPNTNQGWLCLALRSNEIRLTWVTQVGTYAIINANGEKKDLFMGIPMPYWLLNKCGCSMLPSFLVKCRCYWDN